MIQITSMEELKRLQEEVENKLTWGEVVVLWTNIGQFRVIPKELWDGTGVEMSEDELSETFENMKFMCNYRWN